MNNTTVVDHPLIAHKLTMMRRQETDTALFRRLMREVALLLGFEASRALSVTDETIQTHFNPCRHRYFPAARSPWFRSCGPVTGFWMACLT